VASQPGLPPGAEDRDSQHILRFFREEQERRVAVCMLHHGRLRRGGTWSEHDEAILRMVLSCPIYHSSTWEEDREGMVWRGESVDVGRARWHSVLTSSMSLLFMVACARTHT
jgi:hypothetical protein